jgi:hypothetical protein
MKKTTRLLWMYVHTGKACPHKAVPFRRHFLTISFVLLITLLGHVVRAQQWQILGNEQTVAAATSAYTHLVLVSEGAMEVPYVVYTESGVAKVKKRVADGSWAQVGGNLTTGSASYTRIYNDQAGGLYVTYMDGAAGNKLAIKKYNTDANAWEPLEGNSANLYVSAGSINNNVSQYSSTPRSSLAFDSNHTPYIAFGDNGNLVPFVGAVSDVTAVSPFVYDVTVSNLTGEGSLRVEVKESAATITDIASNNLAGDFSSELFTRVKQQQTITFDSLGVKAYGSADFDAGATASSGLNVAYASSNTDVATIVNGKVHLTGLGITEIAASQPGDNMYKAAATVTQWLTVKDLTPPSQPQALTAIRHSGSRVKLIWLASTDDIGVVGYYLYRDGVQLSTEPVTGTSFITDAPRGHQVYTYTVIAVDAAGNQSQISDAVLYSNNNGHGGGNGSQEMLTIFPNPSNGNFKVRLTSQETGAVTITVSNSAGNIIQQVADSKPGILYQKDVRLQCPTNGLYLVRVTVGAFAQTSILIVK